MGVAGIQQPHRGERASAAPGVAVDHETGSADGDIERRRGAIVRHHRESPAAARARLHQSFRNSDYWGPNGTPQARGWARVIRELYDVYDGLTQGDPRTAFAYGVERDIALGVDALGVRADVVLFDQAGYMPRVVLC